MSAQHTFKIGGWNVKTTREWAFMSPRHSWEAAARVFALSHGDSVVFRADDSAIVFTKDGEKTRRKTIPAKRVRWVQ